MTTPQETEDYVLRLGHVEEQVDQVLAGLGQREDAGILPRASSMSTNVWARPPTSDPWPR